MFLSQIKRWWKSLNKRIFGKNDKSYDYAKLSKNLLAFMAIIYIIRNAKVPVDKSQEEVRALIPQFQMHVFSEVYKRMEGQLQAVLAQQNPGMGGAFI
jgi:hypothetical protein